MDVDRTVSTHTYVSPQGGDTTPFVFGSTVGRFVIRERLGTGGMGEVYRAEDTQLKRTVAIKRLIEPATEPGPATRLLKEAQRASALNHPHIANVYDVFTMGSELLLVMEYVDGATLRERMKREIGVSDFCAIAVQCTEALSVAHRNGILHGDLKPANIMLTGDGQVKICDFGLARRLPKSEAAADTTTTTQHALAGTPAYLSPEAILGQPVDERADIFSLGVVFYQMLARSSPFAGDGLMATLDRVLHVTPEPLDRLNPGVSGRLARTVQRMLEKDPRDRYASVIDVREALSAIEEQYAQAQRRRQMLRRAQAGIVLTAAAVLAIFAVPRLANPPPSSQTPLPSAIHLIVLPVSASGNTSDSEPFIEGLTDSLNVQLARLTAGRRELQVVTEADRRLRGVTTTRDAREQFGANLAFRSSLKYDDDMVEVATALIDTKSDRPLRTLTTAAAANPIAVQTRVLEAAVQMMGIALTDEERTRIKAGTTKPSAHEFYLRGRGYLLENDTLESVELAIALFRKALEDDPRYALASAGLGQALWRKQELKRSEDLVEPAQGNCDLALDRDQRLAEAYICRAMVLNGTGKYELAATAYQQATKLDPTNDVAYAGLASAYEKLKDYAKAERTYIHAIDVRRHYWRGYYTLGSYYYRFSRYAEALAKFEQAVELAPDSFRGHNNVGVTLFQLDRILEAIRAFEKSMSIRENYNAASNLGTLYYFQGEYDLAAAAYRKALDLEKGRYEIWGNLAHVFEFQKKRTEAAAAFQQARELVRERLRVNPRDPAPYIELADYSAALGELDAGKRAVAEALKLGIDDAKTMFRLAAFYEGRLHARDEALTWLTRAVQNGYTWREIDRAPELAELRKDKGFQELRKLQISH
jgi:eukaryotic-like serine/threonine-protein kinase